MKYHLSIRFDIDTDTPEDAARQFAQSLYVRMVRTLEPIEVAVTAVRQGTVFVRVSPDDDAKQVAG